MESHWLYSTVLILVFVKGQSGTVPACDRNIYRETGEVANMNPYFLVAVVMMMSDWITLLYV